MAWMSLLLGLLAGVIAGMAAMAFWQRGRNADAARALREAHEAGRQDLMEQLQQRDRQTADLHRELGDSKGQLEKERQRNEGLQEKLQTGYTPLVCWFAGSDGTQDRALAEACFFGCGAPEWAWSKPEIGLQAREACELAQAALMGGSLEAGTLHYRSQRGALFVTLRNATPKREALKTRFAGLSREAAGRRYALRIWKSGEGSGASEEMSGPTLAARELKVSLNPGQIAVVSALPAGGE